MLTGSSRAFASSPGVCRNDGRPPMAIRWCVVESIVKLVRRVVADGRVFRAGECTHKVVGPAIGSVKGVWPRSPVQNCGHERAGARGQGERADAGGPDAGHGPDEGVRAAEPLGRPGGDGARARSPAGTTTTATSRACTSCRACCASSSRGTTGTSTRSRATSCTSRRSPCTGRATRPTEPSVAVIARAGGGMPTVNVEGAA